MAFFVGQNKGKVFSNVQNDIDNIATIYVFYIRNIAQYMSFTRTFERPIL